MSVLNEKKVENCVLCYPEIMPEQTMRLSNDNCMFFQIHQDILKGSGIIVPKKHRVNVFELTEEEVADTFKLLKEVKKLLDKEHNPDGYNIVWNTGSAAGQHMFHAHLHVIPRFNDEPLAGLDLHHLINTKENLRPSLLP